MTNDGRSGVSSPRAAGDMSTRNGAYSPAFEFKVVLEALRAEGQGVEVFGGRRR